MSRIVDEPYFTCLLYTSYLACIAYIQQLASEGEFELMQEESLSLIHI